MRHFFFYLIRRINETAGSKIIWITDDFHSVTVTQSASKNLCRSNKILKFHRMWSVDVFQLYLSTSFFNFVLFKFQGEIDQVCFWNLTCVFRFVVTHYESRLSNNFVLRYWKKCFPDYRRGWQWKPNSRSHDSFHDHRLTCFRVLAQLKSHSESHWDMQGMFDFAK